MQTWLNLILEGKLLFMQKKDNVFFTRKIRKDGYVVLRNYLDKIKSNLIKKKTRKLLYKIQQKICF